jgi:putative transposase
VEICHANPVRARPVEQAEQWCWSSATAHLSGRDGHVVKVAPALERVGDFGAFLGKDLDEAFTYVALRKAESVGRPVGSAEWLEDMEERTGLALRPAKRGPKPKKI